MPRIPVYQNQTFPDAGPLATSAAGAARTGYYIGQSLEGGLKSIARGVSSVQAQMEKNKAALEADAEAQDIADLTVKYAMQNAKAAVKWKQTISSADPNDPSTQETFMQDITPDYDNIHESAKTAKGRQYSAKARAEAWGSLFVSSATDQMEVSSEAAVQKVDTVVNSYGVAAFNDPGNWKSHIAQMRLALDAQIDANHLNSKDALDLRTKADGEIARSAVKGMIDTNPIAAIKALDAGEFIGVLDGEETAALKVSAEERVRSRISDEKAERAEETKKAKVRADKEAIELLGTIEIDPKTKKATVPGNFFTEVDKWAARNPEAASPSEVMAMKRYANAELKRGDEDVPVNSSIYEDFKKRANAGTLTRTEVLDARADGNLTKDHFEFYMRWVGSDASESKEITKLNKYLEGFKGYIIQSVMSLQDTWGVQRWTDFQSDMQEIVPQLRASGMNDKQINEYIANEVSRYELTSEDEEAAANAILQRGRGMSPYLAPNVEPTPVDEIPARESLKGASGSYKHSTNFPKKFFDLVAGSGAEATDAGRGYNETLAYGKLTGGDVELTNMPLRSVLQLQGQMLKHPENKWNSSAVGRYQIVRDTLRGLITKYDLSLDAKFTPELQDFLAVKLLEGRIARGDDILSELRNEWEGLQKVDDDAIIAALAEAS